MSKADPVTFHAIARAEERIGLTATAEQWETARQAIVASAAGESRAAVRLKLFSGGIERWIVPVAGRALMVVYRPDTSRILTVLDPSVAFMRQQAVSVQKTRGRQRRQRQRQRQQGDREDWA